MANHKQTKKRILQSETRRLRNRARNSRVKTFLKKMDEAILENNKELATQLLPLVIKEVMKAGAKGLFHKNKTSRKVAQLQKRVNNLK
jgi:small subunit ribosomal protein S20